MSERVLATLAPNITVGQAVNLLAGAPKTARVRGEADGSLVIVLGRADEPEEAEPD